MITEAIKELRASCEECIDSGQPVQIPAAMAPGDMLPQGDVGLLMLKALPANSTELAWPEEGDFQIAPGISRGSRHTIPRRFKDGVRLFGIDDRDDLSELGIVADAPFDLEHPEHANHVGYPPAVYRVCHEQNSLRERVLD